MRNRGFIYYLIFVIGFSLLVLSCTAEKEEGKTMLIPQNTQQETTQKMIAKFGDSQRLRIETGVAQVAQRWQQGDGSAADFQEFCLTNFYDDTEQLQTVFKKYEKNLESLFGSLNRVARDFNWGLQIDEGAILPVDYQFAKMDVFAHVTDDLFQSKLAFTVLLNYPIYSLVEKSQHGLNWSREQWAAARLADLFISRVPAAVSQKRSEVYTLADDYISNYNIMMHNLVDDQGNRPFPAGLKLISHWGLRDELKAQYDYPSGLLRQKMIQQVMERIVTQQIPAAVINSDQVDWNPFANQVFQAGTQTAITWQPEANQRYLHLLRTFQTEKLVDPYTPTAPSLIDRRFLENREMAEAEVEALLTSILTAPVLKDIAHLIQQRLGRSLQPFDIWYNGFKAQIPYTEEQLDQIVSKKYPTVTAFQADLPQVLHDLGFSPAKIQLLVDHVQVDPARGSGHAMGAMMREDKAHLRTRIPAGGMKYKGYNIAIHEFGHNVEQVFSLNEMDHYFLQGVPNTAFTEAFAFIFQSRDLKLLGLKQSDPLQKSYQALNNLWQAFEISGVALVDIKIWHWLYEHPNCTAEQLREAMLTIAREVWNQYFAPILGMSDQTLLAIYSHIIDSGMYIPDYPLGHIISFQIEQYLEQHDLATEMERMCKLGRLTPQVWMQQAVGVPISTEPFITAATEAVQALK